jgi:hypothetical protein
MASFSALLVLLVACFAALAAGSEQKLNTRTQMRFRATPLPFAQGAAIPGAKSAPQEVRGKTSPEGPLNTEINSSIELVTAAIRRSVKDTKRELKVCYRTLARAEDNHGRMDALVEIAMDHKRAVVLGGLAAYGTFLSRSQNPYNIAATLAEQGRRQEVTKWGSKAF